MESLVETNWTEVCNAEDIISHVGICAQLGEKQVAIFYLKDEQQIYAIDNYDPVGEANVLSRGIVGDLNGEVVVASPLYKQHYNLATGVCLEKSEVSLHCYPVRDRDGVIELGLP